MTELFIAFAVTGALLCWRHVVKPFGRVLELGDDLNSEERSARPGAAPQPPSVGVAERPDAFAREAPTALVLPPK
jgi:hypothetical protein